MAYNKSGLPRGILPDGIDCPPGTDIMQFCRDLAESGADFAEQFDRNSSTIHDGLTTPVPTGGQKVPNSMGGNVNLNWQALPNAPLAIDEDFGPEYHAAMDAHKQLGHCKKAISVVNKPVEMVMRLRVQYKEVLNTDGDDKTAWESRLKGAENERNGALSAATITISDMSDEDVSLRTRECVKTVVEEGQFKFEDKERYAEYMMVLQRANQTIFADQTKLLARIKAIKKAAKTTQVYATATSPASDPALEAPPSKPRADSMPEEGRKVDDESKAEGPPRGGGYDSASPPTAPQMQQEKL